MSAFVHLHNHSEYSLLDGIARVGDMAARLKALGYDAYALTDHGVMYGSLEFYLGMQAAGIKPIVGCEVYVASRKLTDKDSQLDRKSWHCVLLAQNEQGYVNLMRLTSIAHRFGYYYKPRVDVESIRAHSEGLICLTACPNGVVAGPFHGKSMGDEGHESEKRSAAGPAQSSGLVTTGLTSSDNECEAGAVSAAHEAAARRALETYLEIFSPERLFLEIQNHGMDLERSYNPWAADMARSYGLRLVATNDCHYVSKDDARAHDICLCLRDKKLLSDEDRLRYSGPEYYIKTPEEMAELFSAYPEALANTRTVADLCNLSLDLKRVHFPQMEVPLVGGSLDSPSLPASALEEGGSRPATTTSPAAATPPATTTDQAAQDAWLRHLVHEGARKRYGSISPELQERIDYELGVIIPKGFTTYFLICHDFCDFARSKGIPVGPGRGSAAGSVVAYCLEITDLDPIKYGLYFERFLNPERIELPDADIDFCYRRRDEVIEHVKNKYGADRVAMIITYSRLKARAVIKAVGRTKGIAFQYTDKVTKEINGLNPSIDEAIDSSKALQEMIKSDPEIAELIDDARKLEGIAAYQSVHAAGIVIAPDEISNFVPVQPIKDSDLLVTQYSMDYVPKAGLVKFDFLGLRNLTMIEDTAQYIRRYVDPAFDARFIPEEDPETYAMLQRGDNYGVFQFEAPQVRRMLIDGRPENVIDLAAINAANRPGPLQSGGTAQYLEARKAGKQSQAKFKSIATILESTGGVLLFQEQVLEIAKQLGGFSLGEADLLRKAMGKKNMEVMMAQKEKFLAGAKRIADEGGARIPPQELEDIWQMMETFAGYGFNKAHSVCYAWIAFQTAWLKCHYPHYFMCAMLNSYLGSAAKLAQILAQCRRMRIQVLPPSVNAGELEFTPTPTGRPGETGSIIFGLGGIKGLGSAAVEVLLAERERGGAFKDLADFHKRTKSSAMNKKVLQSLACAGAFDCLEPQREKLIKHLDDIDEYMEGAPPQLTLGGFETGKRREVTRPTQELTRLDIAMLEKEAIGLFLTEHPYADHPMFFDERYVQLERLQELVNENPAFWQERPLPARGVVGLLTSVTIRMANTSNKPFAKARLEDPERGVELVIWPRTLEAARELVQENNPVIIWGKVQTPDVAASASEHGDESEAFDGIEIVVDKIEPYSAPPGWAGPPTDSGAETRPQAQGGPQPGTGEPVRMPQASVPDTPASAADPPPQASRLPGPSRRPVLQRQDGALESAALGTAAVETAALEAASQEAVILSDLAVETNDWSAAFDPHAGKAPPSITWSVDLSQADAEALRLLASTLENTEGEQEVRMLLKDVSGKLRQIRVGQRFFIDAGQADAIEQQFAFLERIQRGQPQA
ncbi:DNA polymerase III subunit alpha [bacterium]|nr:DNA polymerase III subunit alpha [bacterium]